MALISCVCSEQEKTIYNAKSGTPLIFLSLSLLDRSNNQRPFSSPLPLPTPQGLTGLDPCKDLTEADIKTAIKNSGGVKGSLLIPDTPFEGLVRNAIRRLLAPSLQCNQVGAAVQCSAVQQVSIYYKKCRERLLGAAMCSAMDACSYLLQGALGMQGRPCPTESAVELILLPRPRFS